MLVGLTVLSLTSACLTKECLGGQWQVWNDTKFNPQPAVIVSVASEDEVEAYHAELEREAGHEVKGNCSVRE